MCLSLLLIVGADHHSTNNTEEATCIGRPLTYIKLLGCFADCTNKLRALCVYDLDPNNVHFIYATPTGFAACSSEGHCLGHHALLVVYVLLNH